MRLIDNRIVVMQNRAECELRVAINRISALLENSSVHSIRRGQRLRSASYAILRRELRRLLLRCGFRRIARFNDTIFRAAPAALIVAGEMIVQLRMQHLSVLRSLMNAYEEQVAYNNLLDNVDSDASTVMVRSRDEEEDEENIRPPVNPVARALSFNNIDDDSAEMFATSPSASDISDTDQQQRHPPGEQIIIDDVDDAHDYRAEPHSDSEGHADDEDEDVGDSEDEDPRAQLLRQVAFVTANCREPYEAVERVLFEQENQDENRRRVLTEFYTAEAEPCDTAFHTIENRTRLVWNCFDERSPLDRRVNEFVRRRLNSVEGLTLGGADPFNLLVYARRVLHVRRAQELRWFHDLAEDVNSPLYTATLDELIELLQSVRESFAGKPEQ